MAGAVACTTGGQSADPAGTNTRQPNPSAEARPKPPNERASDTTEEAPTNPRTQREGERKVNSGFTTGDIHLPYDPNEPTPDPSEIQSLDTDAEPLNLDEVRKSIVHPAAARKAGVGGTVRLKLLIDGSGRVADKRVFSSPDARLMEAAWEAAQRLRYRPATRGGKGVKTWVNFSHTF